MAERTLAHFLSLVFPNKELPSALPPEELEVLVKRLCSGDDTVKEKIIHTHLRLAIKLANNFARFQTETDVYTSTALYALTVAVNRFPKVAKDSNITAYIISEIGWQLRHQALQEKGIQLPPSTYHKRRKEKRRFELTVPLLHEEQVEDKRSSFKYCLEIRELFELACTTERDQKILALYLQGYTMLEIGEKINLSATHACRLLGEILQTLQTLWREQNDTRNP